MYSKILLAKPRGDSFGLDNLGAASLDVWHAALNLGFTDSSIYLRDKLKYMLSPEMQDIAKYIDLPTISEEEFKQKYADSGLQYDPSMTVDMVEYLIAKKQQREIDQYIMARGKGGLQEEVGKFAAELLGSNLNPVNIAASFIPIGGQAKWAAIGLKYGTLKTGLLKGLVGGVVGQTAIEPFMHRERSLEQIDYNVSDSVHNILASGVFGAGLHGISHSLGYGFKKLKDRYYLPSGLLSEDVATNNPAINQQFKNLINKLKGKTYPTDYPAGIHQTDTQHSSVNIAEAQAIKANIWQEGSTKFPEFFQQEKHLAKFEETLHQLFATGGEEDKIPKIFIQQLNEQRNKLWRIYDKYSSDAEFMEIHQRLQNIDSGIYHRLESEQQQLKAYDLDHIDLYIAARQLEDGKFIDLNDPNNAKSIFEQQSQPTIYQTTTEKIKKTKIIKQNEIAKQSKHSTNELANKDELLEEAKNYIDRFPLAPSEGFKDYLKQVNLRQVTIARELESGLINDLIKADLLAIFKDKHYQGAIAQEIYNLTGQDKRATNSPKAVACAKIIDKWQSTAVARANRAGANIEQLPGYITRQSHNAYAIRQAGFASWQEFISPLLDWQIMDKDIDLQQVFNNLATGKHLYQCDEYLPNSFYLTDIVKYFKSARKLHFKSVDSWLKYNEIFGTHNLSHSIAINLQKLGKASGLLESMGSNPRATLNNLKEHYIEGLQEKAANNDKLALAELEFLGRKKLDDILDLMIGVTPDNPLLANIDRNLRNIKILSSLGNITLSSIPDSAVFVAEQMYHGLPMIQAFANIVKALTYNFSSKEKKECARLLGVGIENLLGHSYLELNAEQPIAGMLTKATNFYFKINLMDWWNNSFKSTLGLILSNHLAYHVQRPYAKAPRQLTTILERYGINESNWQLYKFLVQKAADSKEYIIPTTEIPHDVLKDHFIKSTNKEFTTDDALRLADAIKNNFRRYLRDRVDTGIPEAHASERYFTTLGTNAGTPLGVAVRMLLQFKQYPITYIARPLKDYVVGQLPLNKRTGSRKDIIRGLTSPKIVTTMFSLATIGGYLSLAAKNLLQGEEMPDLTDPKIFQAAILKGGGAGFLSDFIFSRYNRYGHSFSQAMLGPILADVNDVMSIYSHVWDGNEDKAKDLAEQLVCRNIPGRNLFYLPIALNLLTINPDLLNCYQKR
ncbi:hypothetical protein [Candidatus Tisiphia endosymbiont of Nemotelus uliginosus]|uniref:hypothetical protein n=1 Tax=Candidatus Tisiphia endosymbiont of Nemotelus uliginosus TaxID=3077926 RepID=UPI0035C8A625